MLKICFYKSNKNECFYRHPSERVYSGAECQEIIGKVATLLDSYHRTRSTRQKSSGSGWSELFFWNEIFSHISHLLHKGRPKEILRAGANNFWEKVHTEITFLEKKINKCLVTTYEENFSHDVCRKREESVPLCKIVWFHKSIDRFCQCVRAIFMLCSTPSFL